MLRGSRRIAPMTAPSASSSANEGNGAGSSGSPEPCPVRRSTAATTHTARTAPDKPRFSSIWGARVDLSCALRENGVESIARAAQEVLGGAPVDAGVGDRDAVAKLRAVLGDRLRSGLEVRFHDEADDRAVALDDLVHAIVEHEGLERVVLVRVGVRAVDHDVGGELVPGERLLREPHAHGVVIRSPAAAAQHEMAEGIAA